MMDGFTYNGIAGIQRATVNDTAAFLCEKSGKEPYRMMEQEKDVMLEILERLTKIETKIDSYSDAKKKTYDNEKEIIKLKGDIEILEKENSVQNKEIAELKEKNKWLFRTTAGAVITGLVGIIIAFVSAGVGV